jgi:hypothetical protein
MRTLWIAISAVGAGVLLIGSAVIGPILYDQREPDYASMRSYVISHLTDDQIRKARTDALVSFDLQYAKEKKKLDEDINKRDEETAKCLSDPAIKERNAGNCNVPLNWADKVEPMVPSVDQINEQNLMGICLWVQTVRDAKSYGCLPK